MPLALLTPFASSLHFLFCFSQCLFPRLPAPLLPPARVNPGWGFTFQLSAGPSGLWADDTVYSHACRWGDDWGSFRTVSLSTWANRDSGKQGGRVREAGERLVGRPTTNWWGRAGGVTAQCTITLVFRFGPSERSFWTHLCLDVSSSFFFFSSLFLAWSSLQWKHIPVMPHCCSLFRFLITNSITRMGWS